MTLPRAACRFRLLPAALVLLLAACSDGPTRPGGPAEVTFELLAPEVPEVYLSGDFNDWAPEDPAYRMIPDDEGRFHRLTLELPGEHQYKFVLRDPETGERAWIGDPRAVRLAPDGVSGGYNSVCGVPLPDPVGRLPIDPGRLVIYELFPGDFSPSGDFQGVIEGIDGGLPDLAGLGVTAIELMPVTATLPGFNWGYEPRYYFAVDPEYGTPGDFARLVETAHANGISIILDLVYNHVGSGAPLEVIDEMGKHGTYINRGQDTAEQWGMKDLNWFSPDCRQFLLDAALFWIERFGVDGFRLDVVTGPDYPGYRWLIGEIKARHPDVFVIAEDFSLPPFDSVNNGGFDAQWGGQHTDVWGGSGNNFQNIVMALLKEGPYSGRNWSEVGSFAAEDNPMWALANVIEWTSGFPAPTNEIKYIVSHDERRLVDEVEREGSPGAKALGGIRKAALGAVTLFTATGVPMFYMGEEIGDDGFVPEVPAPNRVDWAGGDAALREVYRNLIRLRTSHPTLAAGWSTFRCPSWNDFMGPCQTDKTICTWRHPTEDPATTDIVVASNYDHADHALAVEFPAAGPWYRWDPATAGVEEVVVGEGKVLETVLPASTGTIYLRNPRAGGPDR